MNDAYERIAAVYDAVVSDTSEDLAYQARTRLADFDLPVAARVLDLGCGTGIASVALARAGYVPRGIDLSPAMIRMARERAEREDLAIEFEIADLSAFSVGDPAAAAICLHDAINHLPPDALLGAFEHVRSALKPGAPFVIDANLTPGGRALSGTCFTFDLGETYACFRSETRDRDLSLLVTLFERDGEAWTREDASIDQVLLEPEQLEGLLTEAGFTVTDSKPIELVGPWVLKQMVVATA